MISVNVIYCNFFQYIISVCFSLMLPLFLSIERQDSPYFLCILPFPFPFSSEVRSQNKSQNLPSVFYIFIFLTFFFFFFLVTLLNHLSSVHHCTERTRKRTQSYMRMHTHVHAFFPSYIHIIHSFVYTIFLTLFRTLSFSFALFLLLSPNITVSLLLHLSFSLEEKRAMSDKPSHMNAYTTHISILNQYGNSKFGEFLGALLRQ